MEKTLEALVTANGAELFHKGRFWIVSNADIGWDYCPLMEILESRGFAVYEGVDLNGENVLVIESY